MQTAVQPSRFFSDRIAMANDRRKTQAKLQVPGGHRGPLECQWWSISCFLWPCSSLGRLCSRYPQWDYTNRQYASSTTRTKSPKTDAKPERSSKLWLTYEVGRAFSMLFQVNDLFAPFHLHLIQNWQCASSCVAIDTIWLFGWCKGPATSSLLKRVRRDMAPWLDSNDL